MCDSSPEVVFREVRVYSYPSGALLETRPFQSGNCVQVYSSGFDSQLSMYDYDVDYRVRDDWGNYSPVRKWRGWFAAGSPTSACSIPTTAMTIWDHH